MSARRDALHSVQEVRFACQLSPLVALVANVRPGHVSCMVQAGLRASRVLFFSPECSRCNFLTTLYLARYPSAFAASAWQRLPFPFSQPSSSPCSSDDSGRTGGETRLEGLEGMTELVTCTFHMGPALPGAGSHDTLHMAQRCRD